MTSKLTTKNVNYPVDNEVPTFRELKEGDMFWRSGHLYVKCEGAISELVDGRFNYQYKRYNVFNLTTLKVGLFKKDTKIFHVSVKPIEYEVIH